MTDDREDIDKQEESFSSLKAGKKEPKRNNTPKAGKRSRPAPTPKPEPKPEPTPKAKKEKPKKSKAEREKEMKRGLSIFAAAISAIFLFFVVINNLEPKKSVELNSFMVEKGELPMIGAHRGGAYNYPENTMLAFLSSVYDIGVGMIESDVHLTKDGYLVFNHDNYIDKTSNVNGDIPLEDVLLICEDESRRHYISDMTLAELESYNFGYYFENEFGDRVYKDVDDIAEAGLQIATVEKAFDAFYSDGSEILFCIEIKDKGELGYRSADILRDLLLEYPDYASRVVVSSYSDDIERYIREEYPFILRGASTGSAAGFIISNAIGLNYFDPSDFACLQIPLHLTEIVDIDMTLDFPALVDRAHKRNISVQYWTINDPDEMRLLIELGCDVITTDNPQLLKEILEEYR